MSEAAWTTDDIGDLTGRTAVVTGPTQGGLGFHTALELARHGARVALAGRTPAKLDAAADAITAEVPDALLDRVVVDLSELGSVREGAAAAAALGPIHLLVNNAGIMATPQRRTSDGLESQMATNHFGPFLFTGLLLDQLVASGEGRVVTLSSQAHRMARSAPLGDPRAKRRYSRWTVYGQTKLANLLFTHELDRRLRRAGLPVSALAAHPGLAGTHLVVNGQMRGIEARGRRDHRRRGQGGVAVGGGRCVAVADGGDRRPAGRDVRRTGWPRPGRRPPRIVGSTPLARDEVAQRRLWELSEETVGLTWP